MVCLLPRPCRSENKCDICGNILKSKFKLNNHIVKMRLKDDCGSVDDHHDNEVSNSPLVEEPGFTVIWNWHSESWNNFEIRWFINSKHLVHGFLRNCNLRESGLAELWDCPNEQNILIFWGQVDCIQKQRNALSWLDSMIIRPTTKMTLVLPDFSIFDWVHCWFFDGPTYNHW